MKKLNSILLGVLFTFSILFNSVITIEAANPQTYIKTFTISETGKCEVYGYIKNTTQGDQITILLTLGTEADVKSLTSENANSKIAYINQITAGNNHSFLFKFNVRDEFIGKTLTVGIGNDSNAPVVRQTYTPPKSGDKFTLNTIANNDVIYGRDVYALDSSWLTARNVADSIVYGGNKIYYKIGNNWYDLLDKNATDSSFLVEENAMSESTINAKFSGSTPLRYYYCQSDVRLEYKK